MFYQWMSTKITYLEFYFFTVIIVINNKLWIYFDQKKKKALDLHSELKEEVREKAELKFSIIHHFPLFKIYFLFNILFNNIEICNSLKINYTVNEILIDFRILGWVTSRKVLVLHPFLF